MTDSSEDPWFILHPEADRRKLAWENGIVLMALQASLGNVGPDVRGIAVEAGEGRVTFHIALTRRSPQSDEDIEDMLFEFEALALGVVRGGFVLNTVVRVGDTGPAWPGRPSIPIFLAHG